VVAADALPNPVVTDERLESASYVVFFTLPIGSTTCVWLPSPS
jgi:hypothetical protein